MMIAIMPTRLSPEALLLSHLLNLFAVPAYVTDGLNRIRAVNHPYAQLVGDPVADGLQGDELFVQALVLGAYRERFPRRDLEVAACSASLLAEVDAGHLFPEVALLLRRALSDDGKTPSGLAAIFAGDAGPGWDGSVVICSLESGRSAEYVESVVPLTNLTTRGEPRYLNLWTQAPASVSSERADMLLSLTPREREIAALYASGLNATEIAASLGISVHTARDHRDSIYQKLDIHSRAELGRLMGPERI